MGKTTQLRRLETHLADAGLTVSAFREPGGTPLGDSIRALLLDPAQHIEPRAEALLFMASRAQLVEHELKPRVERGEVVLLDRFFLSTYAYQIAGRGLDAEAVRAANAAAVGGLVPDLTILLSLQPSEARRRAEARGKPDRMESEAAEFHDRVWAAFESFLNRAWQAQHAECGPIVAVSAEGEADVVFSRVATAVAASIPETFPTPFVSNP